MRKAVLPSLILALCAATLLAPAFAKSDRDAERERKKAWEAAKKNFLRVYKIDEEGGHDPSDRVSAFQRAQEWGERIPIGILYRSERPTREEQEPAIREAPLVKQRLETATLAGFLGDFR